MKRSFYIFICAVFVLVNVNSSLSQELAIAISYLQGEKSKDSHTTDESFAIAGNSVMYSVKYSGHKGKNDVDTDKACVFTEQDLKNIRKIIETKSLNVTDSLFSKDSKYKSFEVFTNISIAISIDGQDYKIKINGDTEDFKNNDLYKNSVYFITMLRKMVKDCK